MLLLHSALKTLMSKGFGFSLDLRAKHIFTQLTRNFLVVASSLTPKLSQSSCPMFYDHILSNQVLYLDRLGHPT